MTLGISVALCTYNGERYLEEQLSSIAGQRRPPDELVVCDDRSTDRTHEILRSFAADSAFPVRIHLNDENLGSTKNFERAISLCGGDVICLADQDDVWLPKKLERIADLFGADPRLALVFTDAELIDERSSPIGSTLWGRLAFKERTQRLFSRGEGHRILALGNVATGATMAFRTTLRDLVLPIPPRWVQDYWIVLLASTVGDARPVPEVLIRYRIHAGQQIGVPHSNQRVTAVDHIVRRAQLRRRMRANERAVMRQLADSFAEAVRRLEERADRFAPRTETLRYLRGKVEHMHLRGSIADVHSRVPVVARELLRGRYHRYSGGWKSAVKDIMLPDRERPALGAER